MAFDLQVFNKQTQTALTEIVDQDIYIKGKFLLPFIYNSPIML